MKILYKPLTTITLVFILLNLCQKSNALIDIEVYIPGQQTRCIAEIFHPRENLLLEHTLISVGQTKFNSKPQQTDGKMLFYIRNSRDTQLNYTKNNTDKLMHKMDDVDRLITVCAENQNNADQIAIVRYSFKSRIHVNDFSNVATTKDIHNVEDATKTLEDMIDE